MAPDAGEGCEVEMSTCSQPKAKEKMQQHG